MCSPRWPRESRTGPTCPGELAAGTLEGERSSGRRTAVQTGLLVLQTALSVLLLAGAGMFGRSLYNLLSQDFGITMDNVVVVDVEQGPGGATRGDLFDAALERVRAVPGVRAATTIAAIPFSGFNVPPIAVPGHAEPPGEGRQLPFLQAATPEFFDILGVKILEGRKLTAVDDVEHGAPVVVVNETMARTVWPGESALGKCIRIGFDPDFDPETATGPPTPSAAVPCREVVGVAHDMRQRSLVPTGNEDRLMQYFVPFSQVPVPPFIPNPDRGAWGLLLKVDADVAAVAPAVRRIIVGTAPTSRSSACGRTRSCSTGRCGRGGWGRRCWVSSAPWRCVSAPSASMRRSLTPWRCGAARWRSGSPSAPGRGASSR